jgi:hypothetical protein
MKRVAVGMLLALALSAGAVHAGAVDEPGDPSVAATVDPVADGGGGGSWGQPGWKTWLEGFCHRLHEIDIMWFMPTH